MTKRIPMAVTAQKKILPYLIAYKARYGYTPSNQEIADKFKYKSAWTSNLLIQELAKAKLIKIVKTKKGGKAKVGAIQILKPK